MGGRVQAASRGCKQSKRWPAAVMDFFVQGHKAVSLQLVLLWFYNDSAALNVCALRPAWWAGKKVDMLTMKITPKVKLRLLEPWKEIWKWFICFYRVESIYRCPHIHIDSGRNPPASTSCPKWRLVLFPEMERPNFMVWLLHCMFCNACEEHTSSLLLWHETSTNKMICVKTAWISSKWHRILGTVF